MEERLLYSQEKLLKAANGFVFLIGNTLLIIACIIGFIYSVALLDKGYQPGVLLLIICGLYAFIIGPILYCGLKIIKPNEALVLTLFGKYYGTLKKEGFFFVNPFVSAINPTKRFAGETAASTGSSGKALSLHLSSANKKQDTASGKRISLKDLTLNNEKQKVNDKQGNPVEIGVVVIWRVVNTVKAVFNVDNYMDFLSIQADSALRNIVRLYPYDVPDDNDNDGEMSLRGSSQEVALKLQNELQEKVSVAGLEVVEAKITHLAYAPEIAAAMLQRQQAGAIVDARKLIVEGAVSMVQMALNQLSEQNIVQLDDERRAAMVSNLLVVLCGNKDAQPIVNSGSIY